MTQWGKYTRPGDDGDEVVLQADPVHREQYEKKGFTYVEVAENPARRGTSPWFGNPAGQAAVTMLGQQPQELPSPDDSEVVKQAMEVALRKMTGTWSDLEQLAAHRENLEGRLLPEESDEMLRGDPLAGYTALKAEGWEAYNIAPEPAAQPVAPEAQPTASATGSDGSGVPQPTPPSPTGTATSPAENVGTTPEPTPTA